MANFDQAYERTILSEGGYKLTDVLHDKGGQTYAGIARKPNPDWEGWKYVDAGQAVPTQLVRDFYHAGYWMPINGSEIQAQRIAENIYDFAVNASTGTAIKLAQIVAGVTPDGKVGPKTLAAINALDPKGFILAYALAKIARYRDIVTRDKTQIKFLVGWINRTLREAS